MKLIYKIDGNGYLVFGSEKSIDSIEELPQGYVDTPLPSHVSKEEGQLPFYRPRWTGTEWIEDMTLEEIDELIKPQPPELTEIEKLKISQAEQFETILMIMGGM